MVNPSPTTQPVIPSHVMAALSGSCTQNQMTALNQAAEDYFRAIEASDRSALTEKPFSNPAETPLLLYRIGAVLAQLELGLYHTVLDFGAGTGWISALLNRMRCRTISLDVSETAIQYAQRLVTQAAEHKPDLDPLFLTYHGYRFPIADETVDRIVCFDAFHHVPNKRQTLFEMARVLRRGGKLVLSEPGPEQSAAPESVDAMEKYGVLESDIVFDEFIEMATAAGFSRISVQPTPEPHLLSMSLEQRDDFLAGNDNAFPLKNLRDHLKWHTCLVLNKGSAVPDSRRPGVLKSAIRMIAHPANVQPGELYKARLEIQNMGDTLWLAASNPVGGFVTMGAWLYDEAGKLLDINYKRLRLTEDVKPGAVQVLLLDHTAPAKTGVYRVFYTLCCEMLGWFGDDKSAPPKPQVRLTVSEAQPAC